MVTQTMVWIRLHKLCKLKEWQGCQRIWGHISRQQKTEKLTRTIGSYPVLSFPHLIYQSSASWTQNLLLTANVLKSDSLPQRLHFSCQLMCGNNIKHKGIGYSWLSIIHLLTYLYENKHASRFSLLAGGSSSINKVSLHGIGDRTHPKTRQIYQKFGELRKMISEASYVQWIGEHVWWIGNQISKSANFKSDPQWKCIWQSIRHPFSAYNLKDLLNMFQ